MKPIVSEKDFPTAKNFVYLNAANVALMYSGAAEATRDWVTDLAEHGSNNFDDHAEENVFKALHREAGRMINATEDTIAAGSSTTELLCSLAWAVAPGTGQNVVSTEIVFPSTVYPWQRVANSTGCEIRLVKEKNNVVAVDDIIATIDQNTAVVCISHVEYGNGQTFDLGLLAEAAHEHGALLVVDATQSAGAIPIDVQSTPVDALASGSYKWLCAPFGAAFMYVAPHLLDTLEPGLVGFRSHRDMWKLDPRRIEYPDTAKKFEFSTMAFGCARGLEASIRYILDIGVKTIFTHNRLLTDQLIAGLIKQNAQIISPVNDKERSAIVTVNFQGCNSATLVQKLKDQQIFVSLRSNTLRFSPHFYNTKDDIEITLDHIGRLLKIIK